jgi:hypothetical protein
MSRSSSLPRLQSYTIDSSSDTNLDFLKHKKKSPDYNKKYLRYNNSEIKTKNLLPPLEDDISNVIKSLNNNLEMQLKARNQIAQERMISIKNNYNEIKDLLDNRINKIENNNKKVLDFMKYSIEQDDIKRNMINDKYKKYIKLSNKQNNEERENLLKMVKEIPLLIQNKVSQLYADEVEENNKQNRFFNELKMKIVSELKEQRRIDNMKYEQLIKELKNA